MVDGTVTSVQEYREWKKRAAQLRKLAKKARDDKLNSHADTLEDRAFEIERKIRAYESKC